MGTKYPSVTQSWRNNWHKVIPMFQCMPDLRRLIYTSNPIELVNRGLRKAVKTRTIFPNDEAVFKLMFLTVQRLEAKWTMPIKDWASTLNQLKILFPDDSTSFCSLYTKVLVHSRQVMPCLECCCCYLLMLFYRAIAVSSIRSRPCLTSSAVLLIGIVGSTPFSICLPLLSVK